MNEEVQYTKNLKWLLLVLLGFFAVAIIVISILVGVFDLKTSLVDYINLFTLFDLLILVLFGILIYFIDALRFMIFSNLFFHKLTFKKAIDCVFANFFFSWITPGASMGAPASAYIMHLDGLPLARSLAICLFKGMSGVSLFIVLAIFFSFLNVDLFSQTKGFSFLLNITLIIYLLLMSVPFLLNFINFEKYKDQKWAQTVYSVSELKIKGGGSLIFALFFHFIFLLIFLLPGVYIYYKFDPNISSGFVKNFLFFVFSIVSPTPGGVGLSEATSLYFYKEMIGVKAAIFVAIAFRFFTFYLQIAIGAIYLIFNRKKNLVNYISSKLFKA